MTLVRVKKLAKQLNAELEDTKIGQSHTCEVLAPHGFRWKANGAHCLVDSVYRPWKPDYSDILGRMNYGLTECNETHCEWCEE